MWSLLSTRIFYHLGYAYTTSKRIPKPLHQSDLKLSTSEDQISKAWNWYHLHPKQCNTNDHRNSGWISSPFQQTVDHSFRSEEFSQKAPELGMKFKFLQI